MPMRRVALLYIERLIHCLLAIMILLSGVLNLACDGVLARIDIDTMVSPSGKLTHGVICSFDEIRREDCRGELKTNSFLGRLDTIRCGPNYFFKERSLACHEGRQASVLPT